MVNSSFRKTAFIACSLIIIGQIHAGGSVRDFVKGILNRIAGPDPQLIAKKTPYLPLNGSREITLHTNDPRKQDRVTRKGYLTIRPGARANIVLCHPAAYDKSFMIPFEDEPFAEFNCIRFDFRRHGEETDGQVTTVAHREIYEVDAAVKLLKETPETKDLPIFGFGISMGGAVLIHYEAKFHTMAGIIVQSTFHKLRHQLEAMSPILRIPLASMLLFGEPFRYLAQKRYGVRLYKVSPEDLIKKVTCPIFLIHARNDGYISIKSHDRLKKAAGKKVVKTWTPETGLHTEIRKTHPELFSAHCREFIESVIAMKEEDKARAKLAIEGALEQTRQ